MSRRTLVIFAIALLAGACSGDRAESVSAAATRDADPTTSTAATTTALTTTAPTTTSTAPAAGVQVQPVTGTVTDVGDGWHRLRPGGDCACSDGSEYSFFVRPGADPAKMLVLFEGGGACWNALTCDPTLELYKVSLADGYPDGPVPTRGIFDFDTGANPFRDHTVVFVPYCTADVHLGARDFEYDDRTVLHRGAVNAQAALDWVTTNGQGVSQLTVAGMSAGSIPAPFYAGLLADTLPAARVVAIGDGSGAYPDSPDLNIEIGGTWGIGSNWPTWPEYEAVSLDDGFSFPFMAIAAANHHEQLAVARVDHAFDGVQRLFMGVAGLDNTDLLSNIDGNEIAIESASRAIAGYVIAGDEHTILFSDDFYTTTEDGVTLRDWLADLISGAPVPDVHCEDCGGS